jgi:CspA family cold shock protein
VPEQAVSEPVVVAEPVSVPEPEPEPEWDLDSETDSDGEPVPAVLPAFDESLLEEIGIKVKLIGNVKWFSRKKGFGFVTKADGEELFFHRSDVQVADLRQLRDGTQVEFQVRRTKKGLEAFDVSILPAA